MNRWRFLTAMLVLFILILPSLSMAQVQAQPLPRLTIGIDQAKGPQDVAVTLQIVMLLTVLSLVPAIILMMTSFTRIVIVFSFLRHGLATQQSPPTQVILGLALFMTLFIMAPVGKDINDNALQPYMSGDITQQIAYERGIKPVREFMLRQTREKDLALFVNMAQLERPESEDDLPTYIIIPAFMISEFRIAFQIGFLLYIPLLVLDMVIASVLMSMGMMMLPPMMISLPFKLILFVLVDGWHLIVGSLVESFR
ncbi:flagellar type III secretion system pore protein FliP [bacterium]|nr:flagellar type III secretion system pore protein FliP [bacterium]